MRDIDKLEALARAATPGPWRQGNVELQHVFAPYAHAIGTPERVLLRMNLHFPYEADAAFIGAAGPDVVLALIAELRKARADLARYAKLGHLIGEK